MIPSKPFLTSLFLGLLTTAYSQHDHKAAEKATAASITFSQVLNQALSDSLLTDFTMMSSVMTLNPGALDTVSHRHDTELFGYVLEGDVQVALVTKELKTFSVGQMFYEKRNVLHTVTKNPSLKTTARVLLIFIIKNGRVAYTPEYQKAR